MKLRDSPRIVIVGFMGAGKTSAARELARLLDDSPVDLDDSITRVEGRTPQELIDEEGEAFFRAAETRALRAALDANTGRIIALGGGAWTIAENRELVARAHCLSVWLDAPFDLCWQRIANDHAGERPLAREREGARVLYEARRATYALADRRIVVGDGKTIASVASVALKIEKLLRPIQDMRESDEANAQGGE